MNFPLQSKPLILDGATGTELNRRGVDTGLPLWSANALLTDSGAEVLRQVHLDYLNAGATLLTANTFRTHRRALGKSGFDGERARELTHRAVAIAKEAIAEYVRRDGPVGRLPVDHLFPAGDVPPERLYVAGSVAPLEDCYTPGLVPPDDECRAEHSERIHHLVEAGADILLIETMNTIREARIAAKLAVITGLPVIVSFVCGTDGRLLSGESLTEAAQTIAPIGPAAIGVNCTPTPDIARCLAELRVACDLPLIAYGNIGHADDDQGWVNTDAVNPKAYARYAAEWPAAIIGGCCGTTPEHIRELTHVLR
jgi:S-methylmethionine-dependent homocysteine/selenocysteine methylase